jgi:hypothetical protein
MKRFDMVKLRTLTAVIPAETIEELVNYVRNHNYKNPMNKITQANFVNNAILSFLREVKKK